MLVTLKEILAMAEKGKYAVGAFNTPNFESLKGIIAAAENANMPVILMHAQVHEEMGLCTMEEVAPLMLMYAKKAKVPVCVHLDHGTDLDYVKRGIELGFTSVMYDGSDKDYSGNLAGTRETVAFAKKYGASVEAEVGSMGKREGDGEDGHGGEDSIYTDPETARRFTEESGIDALACAFGTVHGIYLKEPKLDFERLAKIRSLVKVPLVMHGGSGVSDEDYKKVIDIGIRKINYYTYLSKAEGSAVAALAGKTMFFHDMAVAAEKAAEKDCGRAIKIFANK